MNNNMNVQGTQELRDILRGLLASVGGLLGMTKNLTSILAAQQDQIHRLSGIVGELVGVPRDESAAPVESPALVKARQEIAELERMLRLADENSETFGGENVL